MRIALKLISAAAIASTLGALAPLLPAQAADPAFCRRYADAAQDQVRAALGLPRCRTAIAGSRWSSEFKVHYDWCLTVPRAAADTEQGIRTGYLQACR